MDFIYERYRLPDGIKIEEITGGARYKGKVWRQIALQIYCENGKEGFREIGHYPSGAPFLYGADERISISHTEGFLVVATRKIGADANPSEFSPSTALGVDAERSDREKVMGIRKRFLTGREQEIVPESSLEANIIAWTCKEAMLKAGMDPAIDWLHDITIDSLPTPESEGKGTITLNGEKHPLKLVTRRSGDFIFTIAF